MFDGDPGKRRLTRYRYNSMPVDRPGRYVYIRDMDDGVYWSPTWQPVMKEPEYYECRHGLSYTIIKGRYDGIETEMTFYIPEGKNYELWTCKIKNVSGKKRDLKIFPYVEFAYYDAQIDNLEEWARYLMTCRCEDKIITYDPCAEFSTTGGIYGFFSTNLEIESFECVRDKFIGMYRSEQNPVAVERGYCGNENNNADQSCGAFCCPMALEEEEEKQFLIVVGAARECSQIPDMVKEALDKETAAEELQRLKEKWGRHLSFCQIDTPDEDMNKMINIWHAYQCATTFNWSRFVSYYERGFVRGWGFRDSMQDVLGIMHAMPESAKSRIKTLLSIQQANGNAKNVYYPASGETKGGGRSDDHLWSVYSLCAYIKETGDYGFLDEIVPYEDCGEGTVLEHLLRGLEFTRENVGDHNIPKFLKSDWNDSISAIGRGGKAESAFVFFMAATAAYQLKELLGHLGRDTTYVDEFYDWCKEQYPQLWDGKWFIRAFTNAGEKFGTDADEWNKIFLNPQSWAVLSHLPTLEEANTAFDCVNKYLLCDFGYISHYPASPGYDFDKNCFFGMHIGIKENGGVFCHANTWAVIAQTMLGRADDAFKVYKATLPCLRNDISDTTLIEPYAYASALLGPAHERFGAGSNSWLTGTASWMYYAATQYILGFRTDYDGLTIDPCIPSSWDGFKMTRIYRGIKCHLTVKRSGTQYKLMVDGEEMKGKYIPYELLEGKTEVEITVAV